MDQQQPNNEEQMAQQGEVMAPVEAPQQPLMEPGPEQEGAVPQKNVTIVVVLAVIVVVLALMYMWGSKLPTAETLPPAPLPETDPQTENLRQVGTADDVGAIEADLNATDLNDLDSDLSTMEDELNALPQ